ncbi:MAG: ABC transporter permease [Microbacterium sp.]
MTGTTVGENVAPGELELTAAAETAAQAAGPGPRSRGRREWAVTIAVSWIGFVLLLAIFADLLPIADSSANIEPSFTPPFQSWPEFLGTDQLGRSVVSRLVYGARVSLAVGLISALLGMALGLLLGMLAGTQRRADHVVSLFNDSLLAFPGIVFLLALGAAMGPGMRPLIIGLTLFSLPVFVRLSRANTKLVKHREYVEAARLIGASNTRVLTREILPSVLRPVMAYAVVVLAGLMVAEASVSFLGLGVVPPTPSWGGMIAAGQPQLRTDPELVLVPAVVLFLTVFSFGVIGRWLRRKTSASTS